jgi:hypothetical protein
MEVKRGDDYGGGADDRFWWQTPQDYSTHNITFPFPIRIIRFILSAVLPSFKQLNERTIHTEYDTYGIRYIVRPRLYTDTDTVKIHCPRISGLERGISRGYDYTTLHDYTGSLIDTDTRFCLLERVDLLNE